MARQSVLLLIRDKLGDSLIAANVALALAKARPDWAISLLIRSDYAYPLRGEDGVEVIPFKNGIDAMRLVVWWRLSGRKFDKFVVLRGFGTRTRYLIKSIPAKEVIVHDQRLADLADYLAAPASSDNLAEEPHYGPSLRAARALVADLPRPEKIEFAALAHAWRSGKKRFVAICPLSDEPRRNIPTDAIEHLVECLGRKYPGLDVVVLVRRRSDLRVLGRLPDVPFRFFQTLPDLCRILADCISYYGTDTGLLHLAMAMNMPCTVFFGPTQPIRVLPKLQPDTLAIRTAILADKHCNIKSCKNAVCIARAVEEYVAHDNLRCAHIDENTDGLPMGCPLLN